MQVIRIGTRGSDLAMWQAEHVASHLCNISGRQIEVGPIKTEGDRRVDVPLSEIGGKGLFIKELEHALVQKDIDIAVHSMKDVTVNLDSRFCIPVILKRENPYDALISSRYQSLADLPLNAVVGTSSLRRKSQLLTLRPDLDIQMVRGNVPTRLRRLDEGRYDAIVLAVSGLKRLGMDHRITQVLRGKNHIPSPGQGALGIECRSGDEETRKLIAPLNHAHSSIAVQAERLVNRALGGSCVTPIGIHASISDDSIRMSAWIGSIDGRQTIRADTKGPVAEFEQVAQSLAKMLEDQGAQEILDVCESG